MIKPREEVEDYIEGEYKVSEQRGSRTEHLKKHLLEKIGAENAEKVIGLDSGIADKEIEQEAQVCQDSQGVDTIREETVEIHSEIKRLIAEKHFTEERLIKALEYYEVDSIDSLDPQSGIHFINQLAKL